MQTMTDERAAVEAWRLKVLLDKGFTVLDAERLAASPEVDLRRAVDLVERGCPHDLVVRILT